MAEPTPKQEYIIGVDLGGTKILAGVFTQQLKCITKTKLSTKAERGPKAVIERVARCIRDAVDECDLDLKQIKAIGMGAPGAVDGEAGKVIFAPNLGWRQVPLQKQLQDELGVPVFIENDCNACTLGVYHFELDNKPKHVVGIFLGRDHHRREALLGIQQVGR